MPRITLAQPALSAGMLTESEASLSGFRGGRSGSGYFRNPSHVPLWEDYCRHLPPLPIVSLARRDDLPFEIELDASIRS